MALHLVQSKTCYDKLVVGETTSSQNQTQNDKISKNILPQQKVNTTTQEKTRNMQISRG